MQGKTYIGDELFGLFDPPPQRFKKSLLGKSWTNTIHERLNGMGSMSMNKQESTYLCETV
jgi:hypothetical protein